MTLLQISNLKYFIAFSFVILLIFFTYYFLQPNKINFFFDNIIAHTVKEQILNQIDINYVKKNDAKKLLDKIKEFCPSAVLINIFYKSNLNAEVKINIDKPVLFLKYKDLNYKILTQKGLIDNPSSFREDSINNLSTIFIDEQNISDSNLKKFIECALSLNYEIFENYSVTWCSELKILLKSITFPNFLIIADSKTIHNKNKLNKSELMYKQKDKNVKSGLKVDIRLKDSIVCAPL